MLTRRALPEWIPAGDSNSPVSSTEAADRHLSLPGMNLALINKENLEPHAEVESAYPIYKTGASPSMLAGHSYTVGHATAVTHRMEREERIELSWPAWKAGTQPMSHSRVVYLYGCQRAMVADLRIERSIFCTQDRRIPNFPVPAKKVP